MSRAKRSDILSLAVITAHLAMVFLPVYLAPFLGSVWSWAFCLMWFGVGMNGILNLLHECSHLHVFKTAAASEFLGRWILGPLVLADFDAYQKRHWRHHRDLGKEEDPKYIWRVSIRGWRIVGLLLRCVLLVEAVKKFSVQTPVKGGSANDPKRSSASWMLRTVVVQTIFFATIFLTVWGMTPLATAEAFVISAASYLGVYIYGLASITVFLSSLRAIAEHQPIGGEEIRANAAALRNFSNGIVSGFILGAYGFKDHASHHRDPGLPYYVLGDKTRQFSQKDPGMTPRRTYLRTLMLLVSSGRETG